MPIIDVPEELPNVVKEIAYIDIYVSFNKKATKERENRIIDHLIKNLPDNNDHYYIEHEESLQTFKVLEDPKQKDKDRLNELIINTEEKLSRSKKKSDKAELRPIIREAIKLLNVN